MQDLAKLLLNNLDFSQNPINDFNDFVCKNYYKTDVRRKRSADDVAEKLNIQKEMQVKIENVVLNLPKNCYEFSKNYRVKKLAIF